MKIRELRKKRQMTLADLSASAGISIGFLSQIENGKSALTLVTLNKIANALGIPLNQLFEQNTNQEEYVRKSEENRLEGLQRHYKSFSILSGRFENRKLDAFRMTMEPHFEEFEELSHEGEEFYYVIKGNAIVKIDGKEHEVHTGETIHFPSGHAHKIMNREDEELEMICVLIPLLF